MFAAYRPLLAVPRAGRLYLASVVARSCTAAIGLPIVFVAKDASGSFAVAGAALGAYWAGVALAAPVRGRWVDRRGIRATIPPLAAITAAVLVAMPLVAGVSAWLLVPFGLAGGLAMPPLFAITRAVWRRMLGDDDPRLPRAYALESATQDGVYLAGPLLAGAGIATIGPRATLVVAAAGMLPAAIAYARLAPAGVSEGGGRTPIRIRGVQVLLGAFLLTSTAFGTVEVAVPAFADERGHPGAAGVLLALFALGGLVGALLFGARTRRGSPARWYVALGTLAVAGYALQSLADSLLVLGALGFVVAMPFTAQFVAMSTILDGLLPPGSDTETMTWLTLGNGLGVAGGSAIAGALTEASGTPAAFLAAAAVAACGVLVALAGRRSLVAAPGLD